MKIVTMFSCIAVLAFLLSLSGCSSTASVPPNTSPTSASDADANHSHAEHAGHDHAAPSDMDKMKLELAKLSPKDAASAETQHVCPVGGEMLGTMGLPVKVDVKGRQVWICCDGCKDTLLASPDEYLAKLKKE
jgi:Cu(I)/Ag(I) efflux system membrane fusion protein